MKRLFKTYFSNFETSLKSIIFLIIPFATFFSVMSDRTPYNYINIMVYGILSILIIFYVARYKTFKFDIFTALIITFNLIIFISQLLNKRVSEFPRTIILLSLFSIVIYQFFINVENKNAVFKAILIGGVIFALYFIYTYRKEIIHFDFSDRIGDKFSDQNDLSKYLSVFGLISLISILSAKKWMKVLYAFSSAMFVGIILLTGSISNILCFIICSLILLIVNTKRQNRWITILIIVSIILLLIIIVQLPGMEYFKKRIEEIFNALSKTDGKKDGSAADRAALFSEGLRLFLTRPLFGFGYDQVQHFTHGVGLFSHNNFIELGASFGVLGLLAYETLLLTPLIKMFKHKRINQNLLMLVIYLFIFQFFLIIFRKKIEFILMPLFFSISCFGYYSYYEVGIKDRKLFAIYVKSKKEFEEKVIEEDRKIRVLNLYSVDEFSSGYSKELESLLCEQVNLRSIGVKFDLTDCGNASDDLFIINKKIFKYRKLSFEIDKYKPDVVYVDSNLLNFGFASCIGFSKKIVCYIRNDFDYEKLYKRKSIQYVAFNLDAEKRFKTSNKKNKYHVTSILDMAIKNDVTPQKYSSCFVGGKHLHSHYKDAVAIFEKAHEINAELRFSMYCDPYAFSRLDEHFKKNDVDYIDLISEHSDVLNIVKNSNSVLLLNDSKIDYASLEFLKECNKFIICYSTNENELVFDNSEPILIKHDIKEVSDLIVEISSSDKKAENVTNYNEQVVKKFIQYQYVCLFMLK